MVGDDNAERARTAPVRVARDLSTRWVGQLPPTLDEAAIDDCVSTHLKLFHASNSLLQGFFLALHDRYHTALELQMLERLEQKLAARVRAMEAGVLYDATLGTLQERTETKIFETRTQHEKARQDYEKAQSDGPQLGRLNDLEMENKLLKAQLENEQLKGKLGAKQKVEPKDEMQAIRERAMREEQRKQAADHARAEAKVRWREQMTRELNAKIRAVWDDSTLSVQDKEALVEEVKDEYAQILGRDL